MIETSELCSKEARGFTKIFKSQTGFTLIEVLMVILLIAILTYMGITQFTNFAADAKDATVKANLQILRRGIAAQNAQMRLRCGYSGTSFPGATSLSANDITTDTTICTTAAVATSDRKFVSGSIPANPWGTAQSTSIVTTTAAKSSGTCSAADDGWCYNQNTGEIWANSNNNGTTNEYTF